MDEKIKIILKLTLLVIIIVIAGGWVFPFISSPGFEQVVIKIGIFGPLLITALTIVSHVFAPLAGSPMLFLGYAVYGIIETSLFMYIASILSAIINFEISRKYGRKLVYKLVGGNAINYIDKIAEISGGKILILGRLFGFPIFEIISYAAGLTKISFKKYMVITILFGAIPNLFAAILLKDTDISNPVSVYILMAALILLGFGFSLAMKEYVDRKFHENQTVQKLPRKIL